MSSPQTSTASRVQGGVEEKEGTEGETEALQGGDVSQTLQGRVDSDPPTDEAKISTGRKISKAIVKPFKAIKNLATGNADKYQGLETMEQTQEVVLKELAKGKKSALLERELNKAVSSALSEAIEGAGVSEEELKKTGMEGREVYSKLDKALVAADRKLNFLSYSLAGMLLKETDHEARAKMKDSMAATAVKMAREGNYQGAQVIFDALNQTGVRRPVDRGYEQTSERFEENFKELSDIFARGQAGDLDNHNRLHGSVPYTRLVLHIKKYSDMTKQSFDIAVDASTVKAHGSTVEKTLAAFSSWSGFVGGFGEEARDSNLSSEGGIFNSSSMLGGEFQNAGERLQDMADTVAPRQPRKQST